ncbi:hypothetical protein GOP47_0021132 [Adiantum capillus-veneris]|uniref:F-box domain-containing protein n=1 Tax=Adiantum capillus-veneris TaxID=13818 RepID=A0A9D4Z8D9_ADICA|nr:hypothetical protein GOP47_0021132 [Adiantum capillus-veneris]
MASSVHDSVTSEDEEPRRICNLEWDSDFDGHRFGPSWESYPTSSDDDRDEGPCRQCHSDADEEPHFRVQLLHGSLIPPFSDYPAMDPSLWSRLPPHLLERALAMVRPVFSFHLALVCKSWFSLLSCPRFKKLRFELAKSGHHTGRAGLCASLWHGQEAERNAETASCGTCDLKKSDVKDFDSKYVGTSNDKTCLSGISELDGGGSQETSCRATRGKRGPTKKSGKRPAGVLRPYGLDGADEFLCSTTLQFGHDSTSIEADMEEEFFYSGMSDAVCALEYQPGRLCPGCQPRQSDISYFDNRKVYKVYLSFLPEKFRFFLPPDCVVQDGFVCLFKAESFASPNSTGGFDQMKRLCFCVANPITKSWKELPTEVCTRSDFKKWREDWTVRLEVQNDKFTVCLLTPRENNDNLMMTVNTYSSRAGAWKLSFLQSMRYMTPAYALEGEGKWPCYTICKGFLCTANYRRSHLETMVHNLETGELVYFQDDLGSSSEDDDWGDNPPLRVRGSSAPMVTYESGMCLPFKMASSCKGFFFVARFFTDDTLEERIHALSRGHINIRKAVKMFLKERRQAGFAVWGLELSNGMWKKVSKSVMPQKMKCALMKRPPWNPFKVYKGRGPKDVRILYVDEAVVAGDVVYMFLGLKEDYNFLVCDGDLRLWTGMVAYSMSNDTWELIYHGLIPRLNGNEWHVFKPNFNDLCLC